MIKRQYTANETKKKGIGITTVLKSINAFAAVVVSRANQLTPMAQIKIIELRFSGNGNEQLFYLIE